MVTNDQIVLRLLLAMLLGGVVGFERERKGRLAGLRTHILVCVGASLVMMVSLHIHDMFRGSTNIDPARIAAQVVSGIGFLGAGTILRSGASIKGLTTAAGLWAVAGVGLAIGSGFYFAGIFASVIALVVLSFLGRAEFGLVRRPTSRVLVVESTDESGHLEAIKEAFAKNSVELKNFKIRHAAQDEATLLEFSVRVPSGKRKQSIADELEKIDGITNVRWVE